MASRISIAVPDLRIVGDELAATVDARLAARTRPDKAVWPDSMCRRRHLLSGLIRCDKYGSNYTIARKDYYRCAGHKECGTCDNGLSIRVAPLEAAVLKAFRTEMLTPELTEAYITEFNRETERLSREREKATTSTSPGKVVDSDLSHLAHNLAVGVVGPTIVQLLGDREAERVEILQRLGRKRAPDGMDFPIASQSDRALRGQAGAPQRQSGRPGDSHGGLRGPVEFVTVRPDELGGAKRRSPHLPRR